MQFATFSLDMTCVVSLLAILACTFIFFVSFSISF